MERRQVQRAFLACGFVLWALAEFAVPAGAAEPAAKKPGVPGSREGLNDAWLAADAVVVGTDRGVDSTAGRVYYAVDVDQVWMGTPARGRLLFKAPRGKRGDPGQPVLLFFWDRLAGAPDGFLEESKARYGDNVWAKIGPDSLAAYLLPFPSWSFPFEKDKLVLRGQSAFPTEIPLSKLHDELLDYEAKLQPANLYKVATVVMRARVESVAQRPRVEYGVVVERLVEASFRRLETVKGRAPDTLRLRFPSVPRAPRFKQGQEVLLFLGSGTNGLYLVHGKRDVLHVEHGEVLETGRPLAEFLKTLRGS